MQNILLQAMVVFVKSGIEELSKELARTLDFAAYERGLRELMSAVSAQIVAMELKKIFDDAENLEKLKVLAAAKGMKYKELRKVNIRLWTGKIITVWTPYFLKAKPKRGRKKRGPNGRGAYLGLDVLGFIDRGSPNIVSEVVELAVLCPSFEVAQGVLRRRGIQMDVSTVRRYCRELAEEGMKWRGPVSLSGDENLEGHTLVIGIDGGRLRERITKRGRRKEDQKRQGYKGEWREPKLFTIYLLDAQGEVIKEFLPLHDATMGDHTAMFALLEQYLSALPLSDLSRIVFCGDGASWIWSDVELLCAKMGLDKHCPIHQVLDYTHAQQYLQTLIDLVAPTLRKKHHVTKRWNDLLWNGDIQGLHAEIKRLLKGRKLKSALKKWTSYFDGNSARMQYSAFKLAHIPRGSGSVESAIRRVINMRLKSAGSFWKRDMAEAFLFLRSQLLSGRWTIFLTNVVRQSARALLHDPSTIAHGAFIPPPALTSLQ